MEALSTTEVYTNSWMTVREDTIRRADGSAGIYGVVDKPSYALVIALRDTQVHLVEQFRYPLGVRSWEFPQGTAPDRAHLSPEELAARELREETGLAAHRMTLLGTLAVAPGMSSQRGWVYLATGLTHGEPEREHEEQDMQSAWWERTAMEKAIRCGDIMDAQSLAAYSLLLMHEKGTTTNGA